MRTGILFDVDGTLWDSSDALREVWQSVIDSHDDLTIPCTREDILKNMGKPMDEFAADIFSEAAKEKQLLYLKETEEKENAYLAQNLPACYEGVHETLRQLSETYPLFVVSNCQSGYIDLCLRSAKAEEYVRDFICFGDNGLSKKDNILLLARKHRLKRYYYVGDTRMDYESAIQSGAVFIHAGYGFGTVKAVTERIMDIRQLPALISKLQEEK